MTWSVILDYYMVTAPISPGTSGIIIFFKTHCNHWRIWIFFFKWKFPIVFLDHYVVTTPILPGTSGIIIFFKTHCNQLKDLNFFLVEVSNCFLLMFLDYLLTFTTVPLFSPSLLSFTPMCILKDHSSKQVSKLSLKNVWQKEVSPVKET